MPLFGAFCHLHQEWLQDRLQDMPDNKPDNEKGRPPGFGQTALCFNAQAAVYLRPLPGNSLNGRSEERRVGKECRSRWSPYH